MKKTLNGISNLTFLLGLVILTVASVWGLLVTGLPAWQITAGIGTIILAWSGLIAMVVNAIPK